MAEGIFNTLIEQRNLQGQVESDSAGTGRWHIGEPPNPRTVKVLEDNGCSVQHRARQVSREDYERFDYLIAMDAENHSDLLHWPGAKREKVYKMLSFAESERHGTNVPDPYYGTLDGFQEVYELLVPACEALLDHIVLENNLR